MKDALLALLALCCVTLASIAFAEHRPPNDGLPLVKADFPLCVTVHPGPLRPAPRPIA